MKGLLKSMLVAVATVFSLVLIAQDSHFMYGKVTSEEGDTFEGPIRWGKEEVYWTDMFNASKEENKNLDFLTDEELDDLRDWRSNGEIRIFNISWDVPGGDFVHEFSCAFGNIQSIQVKSRGRADVELKNGDIIEIDGDGYNDVGAKISVLDKELGKVDISWSDLDRIDFKPTPNTLEETFGAPLYGTVESDFGAFSGQVQWDHDERVGTDVLDGETRSADYEIAFEKIQSIERDGYNSSIVTLRSGKELELRGTNDVDNDNKGIIVSAPELGRIDLEWEDFDKVTFDSKMTGPDYSSFASPEKIKGKVTITNGDVHEGTIVYDLDEEYTFEVLNGEDGDTKFIIPFYNIRSIEPRSSDRSIVTLKNGDRLSLEDAQDVSDRNTGILVFTKSDRVYVDWQRVERIDFN